MPQKRIGLSFKLCNKTAVKLKNDRKSIDSKILIMDHLPGKEVQFDILCLKVVIKTNKNTNSLLIA